MKRLEQEKQNERRKISRRLLWGVFTLIFILAIFQVIVGNRLSTSGEKLKELETLSLQLEEENRRQELELTMNRSLRKTEEEAQKLGMEKTTSFLYLTSQIPVAMKQ